MKVSDWLSSQSSALEEAGIGTARLDCLVLLEDATDVDRAHLLANPDYELNQQQLDSLNQAIEQRMEHIPLAYVRGKTEFFGREFAIDESVLEPRPESETMIEMLLNLANNTDIKTVVDVGTGSGALAITVKLELPTIEVIAIDIDPGCLQVTEQNASKHNASIVVMDGNLLEPLLDDTKRLESACILANLPYVPDSYTINEAATKEPEIAIFGGKDGLDLYRDMFSQLSGTELPYVFTESLPFQHKELTAIANSSGYNQHERNDFIQLFKKN